MAKTIIISCAVLLLLSIASICDAQYLVVDQAVKKVEKSDSLSGYLGREYFICHIEDVDTIVSILNKYLALMEKNTRSNFAMREEVAGRSSIRIRPVSAAYGDRYELSIDTKIEGIYSSIMLSDGDRKNRDNARIIKKFIQLLLNAKLNNE